MTPRVRRNEWQTLAVPELGAWEPTLQVSVVIPAYRAERLLPYVLAGLAAQTYPAHLLEVVVANDGPDPLTLPEVRPERTRIVDVATGWGRANACHTGALAAEGEVLHWLDADMLVEADEVEAQARWHHSCDYVAVLGHKWFVDPAPVLKRTPDEVRDLVVRGEVGELFPDDARTPHQWVEAIYGRLDDLRAAGQYALRTHTGAIASVGRDLYFASGGMDTTLRLGEDIALGARLHHAGAVFVPDRAASAWHLGATHVMSRSDDINAYNDPYHADESPVLHGKRRPGRSYSIPYLEVVCSAVDRPHADVIAVVDAVLDSTLHDLVVTVVGPWSELGEEADTPRQAVFDDPLLSARILRATYRGDARVRLVDPGEQQPTGAAFVLDLGETTYAPQREALERLLLHLENTHDGQRWIELPDVGPVRLVRAAAQARARLVGARGADEPGAVADLWGEETMSADRAGFVTADRMPRSAYVQTGGPPMDSDAAWRRVDKQMEKRRGRR